jgi:Ca2+-transporting ATPase
MTAHPRARYGLSHAQAASRLREYGPNVLVSERRTGSVWSWVIRLVADPMVILLGVAGATYALLGDYFDAIVVAAALVPIFAVTSVMEFRSDRALERLNELSPPRARVRRDDSELNIRARDVVPGDILLLREGDVISADATVLETSRLLVDESALTGESLPVEKRVAKGSEGNVFAGTIVKSGRAVALVERTGARTEYGSIARTLGAIRHRRTPIERSIRRIVLQVGVGVIAACAFVVAIERWHGDPWGSAVIAGVSLAMAAIPEELPMVYTLYLALGAWRLAKDGALVRHLSSVETLGATTVICVDKTGTLTYGKLAVQAVLAVEGNDREYVLRIAAMACDTNSGDPLDEAILMAAPPLAADAAREFDIPFDSDRRYAAAVWKVGRRRIFVAKGAYETLVATCEPTVPDPFKTFLDTEASRGARVLAVAEGIVAADDVNAFKPADMRLLGLVALADTVRPAAVDAIARCRRAGIRFVMITGDHPTTARAVAVAVGLDALTVVSGESDLTRWSEEELETQIAGIDVFARVRPEQKLRIVRALHARGDVVAMTGDGTNDALALREADIGIAMGKGGTEVARAAADLVLLDDDVTTIVRAVADGRRIFANLRHAFSYLNAFHAPLLLTAFVLPLIGAPILLLPIHLIWLELIVHPTSALVFENDPPHEDTMSRPPRKPTAGLLQPADWIRALVLGGVLAGTVIAVYVVAMHGGLSVEAARSAAFIAMISGQITLVFIERADTRPVWQISLHGNPAIAPVVLGTAASLALAILWTPLAQALHLAPVPLVVCLTGCAAGCASVLWLQPVNAFVRPAVPTVAFGAPDVDR